MAYAKQHQVNPDHTAEAIAHMYGSATVVQWNALREDVKGILQDSGYDEATISLFLAQECDTHGRYRFNDKYKSRFEGEALL